MAFTFSIAISAQNIFDLWISQAHDGLHIGCNFLRDSNGKEIYTMNNPIKVIREFQLPCCSFQPILSAYTCLLERSHIKKLSHEEIRGHFSQNGTDKKMNLKAGRLEDNHPD